MRSTLSYWCTDIHPHGLFRLPLTEAEFRAMSLPHVTFLPKQGTVRTKKVLELRRECRPGRQSNYKFTLRDWR